MLFIEFISQSEYSIVRNNVHFNFYRICRGMWLFEVSVGTLFHKTTGPSDYKSAQTTMTSIEAYNAYNNILDGGLK